MRRVAYLLALVVLIAGLSFAVRGLIVYSEGMDGAAAAAPVVPPEPAPSKPAASEGGIDMAAPPAEPPSARAPRSAAPAPLSAPPAARVAAARPSARSQRDTVRTPPPSRPDSAASAAPPARRPEPDPTAAAAAPAPAPWQASPRQLVRDSAYVMVNAGRLREAIDVLAAWVAREPADTAVVLDLARLYARARQWDASITQYSNLIARHRTAPLLYERGQTYLWAGEDQRGLADLLASESLSPRVETERQLGDFYRWRGDLPQASYWYRKAEQSAPSDTAVRSAQALLDRAYADRLRRPGELDARDLGSAVQFVRDNAGFSLATVRVGQAFGLGSATVLTASVEQRMAAKASLSGDDGSSGAFGADLSLATRVGGVKLSGTVGALDHDGLRQVVRGNVTADALIGRVRFGASWRRAPGYELLWAPRLLGVSCCDGRTPVTANTFQGTLSLPFMLESELWASGEYMSLRDDARSTLQVALRRRLFSQFSLLYTGSAFAHEEWSADYYSPDRYLAQSLGIEWARYREHVSFAARLSPGYAWVREGAAGAGTNDDLRRAFQLAGGLDFALRRQAWDIVFSSGLGSGRTGGYRSGSAALFLRRTW